MVSEFWFGMRSGEPSRIPLPKQLFFLDLNHVSPVLARKVLRSSDEDKDQSNNELYGNQIGACFYCDFDVLLFMIFSLIVID